MSRTVLALLTLTACSQSVTHTELGEVDVTTFRRAYNNSHVVRLPEGTLLVDAGLERDAPALAEDLLAEGIDPSSLSLVVLTHGHADHAGGAGWFRETYGVPVLAGEGDLDLLSEGRNDTLCPTDGAGERRLDAAQAETFTPFAPDYTVSSAFDLANLGLRGQLTPVTSHTGGSLVLVVDDAVFAGDLVRGSVLGHTATEHFFQCDPGQARADARAVLDAGSASTWFVGHFGPLTRASVRAFVDAG